MKRREFIALLGSAAVAWPLAARAQQPMPVIGFLNAASPGPYARHVAAFRQGLKELGYIEGQNVAIEFRWAEGKNERLHALVADLVNQNVRVIALPGSTPAAQAAKAVTANIPIVFGVGGDPIKLELVSSLNRPGGNLTGVTVLAVELAPKQLELLHELMPTMTAVAVLINPTSSALAESTLRDLHAATRTRGVQLHVVHASTDSDLDMAFASVANLRIGGFIIGSDAFFTSQVQKLARLATPIAEHAIDFTPALGKTGREPAGFQITIQGHPKDQAPDASNRLHPAVPTAMIGGGTWEQAHARHEAAGVRQPVRRRCGGMAARGASTAA
jgi:ABC-type uncharacterized transport system substrate-binding protein